LLVDGRLTSYTRKPFVPGTSVVVRDGSTNGTGDLYGIGAALPAGQVIDAALLLERDTPFGPGELKSLDLWMDLMAIPLGAAVEYERAMRRKQNRRLRLADLRLEELEQLPTFEQVEYLLIQEAMRRTRHNKSAAARVLDMSRQGLQKRILRVLTAEA
jgi:DNA-binding NtrC family response regulator